MRHVQGVKCSCNVSHDSENGPKRNYLVQKDNVLGREHVNQEDFGLDVLMTPSSFEDRRWLRNSQSNTGNGSQKLTAAGDGTHIEDCGNESSKYELGKRTPFIGGDVWILSMPARLDSAETADRLAFKLPSSPDLQILLYLYLTALLVGHAGRKLGSVS